MPPKNQPPESVDFMMKYLEEKFKLVHLRLDSLNLKSDSVELSIKELSHIVETMQIVEGKHFLLCPNTAEIKILKEKVAEIGFFKKYWKPFLLSGVITVSIIAYSAYKGFTEVKEIVRQETIQQLQEEKKVFDDKIEVYKQLMKKEVKK